MHYNWAGMWTVYAVGLIIGSVIVLFIGVAIAYSRRDYMKPWFLYCSGWLAFFAMVSYGLAVLMGA